jgi:hypothetical protein
MGRPVGTSLPMFVAERSALGPHRPLMSTVLLLLPMVPLEPMVLQQAMVPLTCRTVGSRGLCMAHARALALWKPFSCDQPRLLQLNMNLPSPPRPLLLFGVFFCRWRSCWSWPWRRWLRWPWQWGLW